MEFNPSWNVRNCLEATAAEKIKVEVHLSSGISLSGFVAGVGDHFAVITRLAGKDFSDALIRIEDVSAVVAQVRKPG